MQDGLKLGIYSMGIWVSVISKQDLITALYISR